MNIINQILADVNKPNLGFGIHENVRITKIDGEKRKNKDGSYAEVLLFLSLGKYQDGKVVAETENRIWPIKTNSDLDKLTTSVTLSYVQLASFLLAFYPEETVAQSFNPFAAVGITDPKQIRSVLNTKSNLDVFNQEMKNQFISLTQNFVGSEDFAFRLKMTTNEKQYDNLPSQNFVEPMSVSKEDSKLKMSTKELQVYQDSITPKQGDSLAGMPAGQTAGMPPMPGMPAPEAAQAAPAQQAAPQQAAANPLQAGAPQATQSAPAQPQAAPAQPQAQPQAAAPAPQQAQPQAQPAAPQQPQAQAPELESAPFTADNSAPSQPAGNPLGSIPSVS